MRPETLRLEMSPTHLVLSKSILGHLNVILDLVAIILNPKLVERSSS